MEYLIVGIGGIFGSLARYSLGKVISDRSKAIIPTGTIIINVTGAFLLGIVSSLHIGRNSNLLLADGFLGAYTTFSTFMYEGFHLFKGKDKLNAFIYIFGSVFLGLIGFCAGAGLYHMFNPG